MLAFHLKPQQRGESIFNGIDKFFTENNLDWNKVIECSMDGAPRDVAAAPQTPQLGGAQANFGGPS